MYSQFVYSIGNETRNNLHPTLAVTATNYKSKVHDISHIHYICIPRPCHRRTASKSSGSLLTDLGLSTCDKVSVVKSTRSEVDPLCEETDCLRYQHQHLSGAQLPGRGAQTNKYLYITDLSHLHLPGGDVGHPPGRGAGDHEEPLPGKEEVPRSPGHLPGMALYSY